MRIKRLFRLFWPERGRSKVGRMARLRGQVEEVAAGADRQALDAEVEALMAEMRAKEKDKERTAA